MKKYLFFSLIFLCLISFGKSLKSNETLVPCLWTVTVQSYYTGDGASWELRTSSGDVLLSGGDYPGSYSDTQTVEAEGPLEFYVETLGGPSDIFLSYVVYNENGPVVIGGIQNIGEETYSNLNCGDPAIEVVENDECVNAVPISCGETLAGSTFPAINSGGNTSPDVFYTFTGSGENELVTVSLCGSSYDTYLRVYSDCDLGTLLASNDDLCDYQSELNFLSDGISTYIILVEGYGAHTGEFEINVSCEPVGAGDGCLDASFGQYPSQTFIPECTGEVEDIIISGYAGEYSLVQVTAGITYTFSSSVETDFITISDEAGTIVLAYGTESVEWTALTDGFIRFYTHLNAQCQESNATFRSRSVQCNTLGNGEFTQSNIQYYPNPVKNLLNIEPADRITSVSVYTVDGKLLGAYPAETNQIDFSSYAKGSYIVVVSTKKEMLTIPILKN